MLKVTHDGTKPGEAQELCCMCRAPTRYWHYSDVALCPTCAKITKREELPTKADWCAKEEAIARARKERSTATAPVEPEIEWQIRGRHHYEWRKTTEALAAEMYRVNPLHVRAVTVVTGAVPKGGV